MEPISRNPPIPVTIPSATSDHFLTANYVPHSTHEAAVEAA